MFLQLKIICNSQQGKEKGDWSRECGRLAVLSKKREKKRRKGSFNFIKFQRKRKKKFVWTYSTCERKYVVITKSRTSFYGPKIKKRSSIILQQQLWTGNWELGRSKGSMQLQLVRDWLSFFTVHLYLIFAFLCLLYFNFCSNSQPWRGCRVDGLPKILLDFTFFSFLFSLSTLVDTMLTWRPFFTMFLIRLPHFCSLIFSPPKTLQLNTHVKLDITLILKLGHTFVKFS